MSKLQIAKRNCLVKKPLIIEGISRTGKFFLGKVLDGFERVEHFQYTSIIEHAPFLHRMGLIPKDTAIALMQNAMDENAYHMQIGRNLNFRINDHSTLLKSPLVKEYRDRLKCIDESHVSRNLGKKGSYASYVVHECMSNIEIIFEAFKDLKCISIQRHPVDIINSWYLRGFGEREVTDPLSFQPCIEKNGNAAPWFAHEWLPEYSKMPRMDRVIRIICGLFYDGQKTYQNLSDAQKKKICVITHEGLIEDTQDTVDRMARFLKVKSLRQMPQILKREGCFRELSDDSKLKKIKKIKRLASKKYFDQLMKLSEEYEQLGEKILK